MSRFDGLFGRTQKFAADGVEVDRFPQPRSERGHCCFGVVAGTVEPLVYQPLDPLA